MPAGKEVTQNAAEAYVGEHPSQQARGGAY